MRPVSVSASFLDLLYLWGIFTKSQTRWSLKFIFTREELFVDLIMALLSLFPLSRNLCVVEITGISLLSTVPICSSYSWDTSSEFGWCCMFFPTGASSSDSMNLSINLAISCCGSWVRFTDLRCGVILCAEDDVIEQTQWLLGLLNLVNMSDSSWSVTYDVGGTSIWEKAIPTFSWKQALEKCFIGAGTQPLAAKLLSSGRYLVVVLETFCPSEL